jgi:hypothetical protein
MKKISFDNLHPLKHHETLIPPSKYEMNLAEFPLTILSKRIPDDIKVIKYTDAIRGKDGAVIKRAWTISPDVEHGFGSNQLNATLFALFQLWKEQGFESPYIRFGSVYHLVKLLGLRPDTTAYERVRRDLNALIGFTIEAKNAFWDNELKAYVDATFHLFDEVHFYHDGKGNQQALPFSFIKASDKLRGSVLAHALTTLDIDIAQFCTYTPAAQRLALYLSKVLYARTEHRRDVEALAHQFPIYAKRYKDIKKILMRACDDLNAKGFPHLTSYRFEKKHNGRGENIIFSRTRPPAQKQTTVPSRSGRLTADERGAKELLIQDLVDFSGHDQSRAFYARAVYALDSQTIYRAISETKDAYLQGKITTSKARLLNTILQRLADEQGIQLTDS